eukprot:GHVQ01038855.1.p1 GENE.GHVQ01038855.1~~GHVQ01038855.1.p1  ORF type:complete len:175 (+),score=10.02 GHVQ01038855.1:255-779(+)
MHGPLSPSDPLSSSSQDWTCAIAIGCLTFARCLAHPVSFFFWSRCFLARVLLSSARFLITSRRLSAITISVSAVLENLCDTGLYRNVSKLKIFQREQRVLGHVISESGMCADPQKVQALLHAQSFSNKTELKCGSAQCSSRSGSLQCGDSDKGFGAALARIQDDEVVLRYGFIC